MTTATSQPSARRPSRVAAVFAKLHGRPVEGVTRWIVLAAYATTLTVLPSCVWRLAWGVFDLPIAEHPIILDGGRGDTPAFLPQWAYLIFL